MANGLPWWIYRFEERKGEIMRKKFFAGRILACAVSVASLLSACSNPAASLDGSSPASNPDPAVATYTVTFDGNAGGASVSNLPAALTGLASGAKIASPTTTPTLAGKVFAGWYKETSCANIWNFDTDTVTANTTLYAKWVDSTATFSVTFDANAGSDAVTNMPVAKTGVAAGSKITAPSETPTRSGYTFAGWYRDADCKAQWLFGRDTVTADVTLYVKWLSGTVYTITFDTGSSGWIIDPLYAKEGEAINLDNYYTSQVLSYAASDYLYKPSGLYEDSSYQTSLSHATMASYTVTSSKVLYVKMPPVYVMTFNANGGTFSGGSTVKTYKVAKGESMSTSGWAIPTPTRANSVFSRWTSDTAGSTTVDLTAAVTGPVTVYAQWTILDTGLSGYWIDDSSNVLYLDAATGNGLVFYGYIVNVALTDTTISYNGNTSSYAYANNVLTIGGSTVYTRLSTTMSAGGSFAAGRYYLNNMFLSVSADGTLSIRDPSSLSDFFTGKWACDGFSFYVLNSDSYVVYKYAPSMLTEVSTTTLGGYYYNFAGSADNGYIDAYSFYLNTDGTCTLWVWNQAITGYWCSTSGTFYITLGTTSGYSNYYCSLSGATLTVSSVGFTQSSTKGTVGTYTEVSALNGTWSGTINGTNMTMTFTADGKLTMTQSQSGQTITQENVFTASGGYIYFKVRSGIFDMADKYPYTVSGNSLVFAGYSFTKQ
jgi:uncharacterized repeat protein (TIGR02543 family)